MKPGPYPRFWSLGSPELLLLALAAAASVAVGATVTKSPIDAIVILIIFVVLAIALTRPLLLFATGIVLLAVEPVKVFGANSVFVTHSEAYKVVLYACFLPLLFKRGVALRKCAPLVAYAVVTILSEAFGTRLPGLTTSQTAASLASLALAWLIFAIDWDWCRDHALLKALAWVPIASVLAGAAFQAMGLFPLFTSASPPRLQGATITAWLGTFGVCGAMACLALYRREQWKLARWVGFADVVILGGTLTRGAILTLGIVALPATVRFGQRQLSTNSLTGMAKLGTAVAAAIIGAAVLVPGVQERNEHAFTYDAARRRRHTRNCLWASPSVGICV